MRYIPGEILDQFVTEVRKTNGNWSETEGLKQDVVETLTLIYGSYYRHQFSKEIEREMDSAIKNLGRVEC
jgi:hypothetical protein